MAFRNLREFIQLLEQRGELIRVKSQVDPESEITEISDRISKGPAAGNKALLFENVKGSAMPVLINAFGSASRMAWALGVDDLEDLNLNLARTIDLKLPQGMKAALNRGRDLFGELKSIGLGPKIVGSAPVQEIVLTGDPRPVCTRCGETTYFRDAAGVCLRCAFERNSSRRSSPPDGTASTVVPEVSSQ